jgi:outer membrane protein assembly factor BamB
MSHRISVAHAFKAAVALFGLAAITGTCDADQTVPSKAESVAGRDGASGRRDWPQLGGTSLRNNVAEAARIPEDWDIATGRNVKWTARLGSKTCGNVAVANGKVFVGTTDAPVHGKLLKPNTKLGTLLCFREADGQFLWQQTSVDLRNGKSPCSLIVQGDLYGQWGNCSTPIIEGDRLWYVTNRGEVMCLDTEGFSDHENDGPFTAEKEREAGVVWNEAHQADVVWTLDMMQVLGVQPHNLANCSPTIWGDILFVCTSNGVDAEHEKIPAPQAPSFVAIEKQTGKVLWTDTSPGDNILHGQWSSPAVGVIDGIPQVIFGGGDGWLYSFRADRWADGKPELLWKFDGNPKDSVFGQNAKCLRTGIAAPPVIDDDLVYLVMGDHPAHGNVTGNLWCINPTGRGDLSPDLVVDPHGNVIPHQRVQATAPIGQQKPKVVPNPNSGVVWHYDKRDRNRNGKIEFEETLHRCSSAPAIKNDLLFIADLDGLVHCMNAKNGQVHWTCDLLYCVSGPLIAGNDVYVASEDGDVAIFALSADAKDSIQATHRKDGVAYEPLRSIKLGTSIYTTPVVANGVLYIAAESELFAITAGANGPPRKPVQDSDDPD